MPATAPKVSRSQASPRANPLYERLLKPHDLRGSEAAIPVAYEFDESWDEAQCVAWLVTSPSKQLKSWRAALRRRLRADVSWKDDEHYSQLAGNGIDFLARRELGSAVREHLPGPGDTADVQVIYSQTLVGVVLLDERERAVGYATFAIHWAVDHAPDGASELEVVLDEVWIVPSRRREGLGTLMANAVVDGVWRHLVELELAWPKTGASWAEFDLLYTGDVYSTSGADFMKACWRLHREWMTMTEAMGRFGHLVERSVEYDPRW